MGTAVAARCGYSDPDATDSTIPAQATSVPGSLTRTSTLEGPATFDAKDCR